MDVNRFPREINSQNLEMRTEFCFMGNDGLDTRREGRKEGNPSHLCTAVEGSKAWVRSFGGKTEK